MGGCILRRIASRGVAGNGKWMGEDPPTPRLRRGRPDYAKATAWQARLRQGYGVAGPTTPRLRRGRPAYAEATAWQARLR